MRYNCNIKVSYLVYYWYMAVINLVYIWYIFGIFLYYSWCIHVIYLMMQPMSVLCSYQPQQWHVSCNSDESSRPSNSGVLTAKALHHAGAAMSMRLMTGCGTLAGPRGQPRVGGLSVAKTEEIRRKSRSETSRRAWETRKASKLAA